MKWRANFGRPSGLVCVVRRVHDGFLDAGEHEFSAELPTGMYYVRMQAGDEVLTGKVTVVR